MLIEHGRSGHHTFEMLTEAERDAITDWEVGSVVYNEDLDRLQIVESIGPVVWLDILDLTHSGLAATTTTRGTVELATAAEVAAGTAVRALTADLMTSAYTAGTLTDAAPIAVDWTSALAWTCQPSTNRSIQNPTNGIPNTWRTILLNPSTGGARTITFDTLYLGTTPVITDLSSTTWYLLTIFCISASHFSVSARKVTG